MSILYFQVARDFDALKEFWVRIFREVNKESRLKAIYKLSPNTKQICDSLICNDFNLWLKPDGEKNLAQFKFVFEYPYKKGTPRYSLVFCLDCIKNAVKKYFEELFYFNFEEAYKESESQ